MYSLLGVQTIPCLQKMQNLWPSRRTISDVGREMLSSTLPPPPWGCFHVGYMSGQWFHNLPKLFAQYHHPAAISQFKTPVQRRVGNSLYENFRVIKLQEDGAKSLCALWMAEEEANVEIMSNALDGLCAFKYRDSPQWRCIWVQNLISSKYKRFQ